MKLHSRGSSAVLETTTLSLGEAPGTLQLIGLTLFKSRASQGLGKFFWHELNISFPGSSSGAMVRFFSSKSVPVGLLRGTLATVSLSSLSVGSGSVSSSSIVSSSSVSSFIVGSSSVPISGCLVNFETSVVLCPFEYSTLKARLSTRTSDEENISPYLMIVFVD
jgi:hypothetical protein